jgi:hypothetical protein
MTRKIPLTRGLVAIVDERDFATVSAYKGMHTVAVTLLAGATNPRPSPSPRRKAAYVPEPPTTTLTVPPTTAATR